MNDGGGDGGVRRTPWWSEEARERVRTSKRQPSSFKTTNSHLSLLYVCVWKTSRLVNEEDCSERKSE